MINEPVKPGAPHIPRNAVSEGGMIGEEEDGNPYLCPFGKGGNGPAETSPACSSHFVIRSISSYHHHHQTCKISVHGMYEVDESAIKKEGL